jgi:hypothetical protein
MIAIINFYVLCLSFFLLPISAHLSLIVLIAALIGVIFQAQKFSWAFMYKPTPLLLIALLVTFLYGITYSILTRPQALDFLTQYFQLTSILLITPLIFKFKAQSLQLHYAYLLGCIGLMVMILFKHIPDNSAIILFFASYTALTLARSYQGWKCWAYTSLCLAIFGFALWSSGAFTFHPSEFMSLRNTAIANAQNTLILWKQQPVIGHGTGSFVNAYFNNQALSQNTFYTLLVNHGIIGLGLFLGLLVYLLQGLQLRRDRSNLKLGAIFILTMILGSFSTDILLSTPARLWFILWFSYLLAQTIDK